MPLLDVSEVLDDPMFNEVLTVIRRQQTISDQGRVVLTSTTFTPIGVVTAGSPEPLLRTEDYQATRNNITVHTKFKLIDATSGLLDYQPDTIIWQGSSYLVKKTWDWSKYGAGFTCAECELLPPTEVSPT